MSEWANVELFHETILGQGYIAIRMGTRYNPVMWSWVEWLS